jgi:hypothetical protein
MKYICNQRWPTKESTLVRHSSLTNSSDKFSTQQLWDGEAACQIVGFIKYQDSPRPGDASERAPILFLNQVIVWHKQNVSCVVKLP